MKRCHGENASRFRFRVCERACRSRSFLSLPVTAPPPVPMAKCAVSPHAALPGSPHRLQAPAVGLLRSFSGTLCSTPRAAAWSSTSSLSRVFKSLPQPTPLCHCPFSSPLHCKLLPPSSHGNCSSRSPGACAKPKGQDSIPIS